MFLTALLPIYFYYTKYTEYSKVSTFMEENKSFRACRVNDDNLKKIYISSVRLASCDTFLITQVNINLISLI